MPDRDLTLVDRIAADLHGVCWPEPEQIRARARRRSRRTAVLAATAVLTVVSGSAYAVTGRAAAPVPPPAAASAPVPTVRPGPGDIPHEALLAPADVPLATGPRLTDAGLAETVRVDPVLESCGSQRGVPPAAVASPYSRSQTLLRPKDERRGIAGPVLTQVIYRIDPGQAPQLFGTVKTLLRTCAEWEVAGSMSRNGRTVPTVSTHRWATPVSGFAGDESLMVRHVSLAPRGRDGGPALAPNPPVEVTIVVRVKNLVTVIATGPDTLEDTVDGARHGSRLSYPQLEELGRTAARRMCPSANPSC